MAWKINFWARLLDGDHAHRLLRNQLRLVGNVGTDYVNAGGTYANLFDAHPPFQMDGNCGATSGIAEMLLQSQDPYATENSQSSVESGAAAFVHLLPALPSAFPNGKVTGLMARGGLEVSIEWAGGKLVKATLVARESKPVTVRYAGKEKKLQVKAGRTYSLGPAL